MIVRIDDYPAGVRPIQPGQLDDYDRMLDEFERWGIHVHLGIVPMTYLHSGHPLKHKNVTVCQHGYDHRYPELSDLLLRAKDPFNKTTIGIFDEFKDVPGWKIADRIRAGKVILEREFGEVDTYIPVCNIISENLARFLKEIGFKRILCENTCQSEIPIIKSDYYGKLENLDKECEVLTLHLSWEWDTIQEKGWEYWENLVRNLVIKDSEIENEYKILFKFPIRARKEKLFATLQRYYDLMEGDNFLFLITIDEDDTVLNTPEVLKKLSKYRNLKVEIGQCKTKIEAVNHKIAENEWDIVVVVSDDMIPKVKGYDTIIRRKMFRWFPDLDGCLFFNDGFQGSKLNTLQICGRKWFDRWGYVYNESYKSQRCDNEYQELAEKWGKIKYFDQVIIRHEHPDWGLAPKDDLLKKNYLNITPDKNTFYERKALGFPIGIPKIAHFVWSKGTKLGYLRYLTYKTFKDLHPDWKIMFHLVEGCGTEKTWEGKESLEFTSNKGKDYIDKVTEIYPEKVDGILPNYASDLIRWKVLFENGGFYFDLDQIFVKSFDDLTVYDVVFGGDRITYSGVVGMFKRCPLGKIMHENTLEAIKKGPKAYCEAGNWLFSSFVAEQDLLKYYKTFITPMRYFYPIEESYRVKEYFMGMPLDVSESYAVHWFGGHPDSQVFLQKTNTEIDKIVSKWSLSVTK